MAPTGIQLLVFLVTLMVRKLQKSLPMLWIAGGLAIFTAGGLTGIMLAIAPFDWQVHDTYFIVAHLHSALFGGVNLTFLPMHLTGLLGMPRCVFIYPGDLGWNTLNLIVSVGAFIIAAGFLVFTYDLLRPGKPRLQTRKPWNAGTLE